MFRKFKHRHSIRLKDFNYSSAAAYFITACSYHREILFNSSEVKEIIQTVWNQLPLRFLNIRLDEFVIMPNHVHGIIWIEEEPSVQNVGAIHELPLRVVRRRMLLPKIIGYFKMNTAKEINHHLSRSGIPVWQRNYYERIIRSDNELNRVRQYILDNPKNWENDPENVLCTSIIRTGNVPTGT